MILLQVVVQLVLLTVLSGSASASTGTSTSVLAGAGTTGSTGKVSVPLVVLLYCTGQSCSGG
jgi:hypothetical protein